MKEKYNIKSPDRKYIKLWCEKLFEGGSLCDRPRGGRPKTKENRIQIVEEKIEQNQKTSIRRLSNETGIPKTSVHRILKKYLSLKCWKPVRVQFLSEIDHESRVNCCKQILVAYDCKKFSNLFFSDECSIYLTTGSQNLVMWSNENPFYQEQVKTYPPSVMIWAAMNENHLIGPFFIDGKVTAASYLEMLKNEFYPEIVRRGLKRSCNLQQDGAPAHTARVVQDFLNEKFPMRWVGKFGPVPWPARSPDLTSCDNALWGIVKRIITQDRPKSKNELKEAIKSAFHQINSDMLRNIHARSFRRLKLCVQMKGVQIDPYDA